MPVDDSYTKILLHMNGIDGSTTFTDESGKTWTAHGNAQIDTAQSKFGGASGLFDGSGDYLSTPDHADFELGSGNWTHDFWIRWINTGAAGTYPNLFAQRADGNNYFTIYRSVDRNRFDRNANRWRCHTLVFSRQLDSVNGGMVSPRLYPQREYAINFCGRCRVDRDRGHNN